MSSGIKEPDNIIMNGLSSLWTVGDVVTWSGFSRSSIYDSVRRGEFPGVVRFGRQLRFDPEKIKEFVLNGGSVPSRNG